MTEKSPGERNSPNEPGGFGDPNLPNDSGKPDTLQDLQLAFCNVPLSQEGPVGGRLHNFWVFWEKLGAATEVVDILRHGLKWEFKEAPVLRKTPWDAQLHLAPDKLTVYSQVVETLLTKGAIERVQNPNSRGLYSILFLRPKPSGEWRPIIDLKRLNNCVVNQTFRMESARSIQRAMPPSGWATSVDLTDAYYHIPIHPHFRKYLRFAIAGQVYQFKALPFGLAIAPRIFTKVMLEIARVLRLHSVCIHQYLDDWLIRHEDPESLAVQTKSILHLIQQLGLLVNASKSELVPSQNFEFVGVLYDLSQGRAYPPEKRVQKITQSIQHFLNLSSAPAKDWLALIGLLGSVIDQVPLGRLHIRPLQIHLHTQWSLCKNSRNHQVEIPQMVKQQLRWWLVPETLHQGVPLIPFQAQATIFTDASTVGWGAHLEGEEVSGTWAVPPQSHINVLEMRAVTLALKHFGPQLEGKRILIATDNTTVLAYINHQGGTRSQSLMEETEQLFHVA
jgi:hypothetical protein